MLENLNNTLENILRKDKKYIAENGKILKTYTFEEVRKNESLLYNPSLIREVSK